MKRLTPEQLKTKNLKHLRKVGKTDEQLLQHLDAFINRYKELLIVPMPGTIDMIYFILESDRAPQCAKKYAQKMRVALELRGYLVGNQEPKLIEIYRQWCQMPYGRLKRES